MIRHLLKHRFVHEGRFGQTPCDSFRHREDAATYGKHYRHGDTREDAAHGVSARARRPALPPRTVPKMRRENRRERTTWFCVITASCMASCGSRPLFCGVLPRRTNVMV